MVENKILNKKVSNFKKQDFDFLINTRIIYILFYLFYYDNSTQMDLVKCIYSTREYVSVRVRELISLNIIKQSGNYPKTYTLTEKGKLITIKLIELKEVTFSC